LRHLFDAWPDLAGPLRNSYVRLLLDFDGTLAPIVNIPEKAALPEKTRGVLEKLAAKEWCTVAVVSGRSSTPEGEGWNSGLIFGGTTVS
jgi:trehalose 6-phosphate phosphatase